MRWSKQRPEAQPEPGPQSEPEFLPEREPEPGAAEGTALSAPPGNGWLNSPSDPSYRQLTAVERPIAVKQPRLSQEGARQAVFGVGRGRSRRLSAATLGNCESLCRCCGPSAGGLLSADVLCALAVSERGAAGVWLDLDTALCRYYRRDLPPPLALHPDPTAVSAANITAGVRHWAGRWADDGLSATVFADCSLLEDLSPYRLSQLPQTTELTQLAEPGQLTARHKIKKRLKTLFDEYDITLQYVTPDRYDTTAAGDEGANNTHGEVPERDHYTLSMGSALLDAATWLARHVNADVEAVEERIRHSVGDGGELEVEPNRDTSEPPDGLFES
ncbi:hypothetical protein FJT64_025559 [Amphibalanus amphitrite]|uniref:Uncharacterized protein n=1 Tax=Amphibalanus amphitrite TaxID=1232801 RepID=A0A6A4W304_AMPAM|nr:hypothetical protein FJT64_025559 [Amphibalanus amphitrite]